LKATRPQRNCNKIHRNPKITTIIKRIAPHDTRESEFLRRKEKNLFFLAADASDRQNSLEI
jgi:hypothetical protein